VHFSVTVIFRLIIRVVCCLLGMLISAHFIFWNSSLAWLWGWCVGSQEW
jgi:hypothetical protein